MARLNKGENSIFHL